MWRSWIEEEEGYSLLPNFMTANCYACIELNAHAAEHHLFLTWLMSSQPCECCFKILRSSKAVHCGAVAHNLDATGVAAPKEGYPPPCPNQKF